jgi:hypothetical protein
MAGTNSSPPFRPPCNYLQYILEQLVTHNIPIEQIASALEPHYPAEEVKGYLAGNKTKDAIELAMVIPEMIQDIADAEQIERNQIEGHRDRYVAPYHPGIKGRECAVITPSREQFLELCRLSQPELVDALGEETAEVDDEADSGEEDNDEQEKMDENTVRTIGDAILEADEFARIEIPEKKVFLTPWLK